MIRRRMPFSTIVSFWHIPWPNPAGDRRCPWTRELLEGLLGSSILGFQTADDCRNFIETVASTLDATINRRRNVITYAGHRTRVRAYPVSVEWPSRWAGECPSTAGCREWASRRLQLGPDVRLGVGIDRLDYTKGINEKFLAVEQLLQLHPELRGRFVFVQVAEPSRSCLPAYRELRSHLVATCDRVNRRFGGEGYRPIVLLESHHEPAEVFRLLRAADFCYVGSLHDGMNLVAKEFVSARDDNRGVLILSKFAGAARELTDALIVDPNVTDDSVRALVEALRMPEVEQSRRMRAMRAVVAEFNAHRWAGEMLADAMRLRAGSSPLGHAHESGWQLDPLHAAGGL
jgi:trehalose 6-phosphate synthase